MARSKATLANIDKSDPSNYLEGRVKDNTGAGGGTPVNEFVYGDLHQTFAKLMHLYKMKYNGLPDNETNGYQLIEALIALASKNDFIIPLTSSGGVLSIQLKVGSLKPGESFICKAAVAKGEETTVKGSLDNVVKAATFTGDFKAGEYVRVINNADNVEFVRLVDVSNLEIVAKALKFLQAATQSEEDAGTSEAVSTTPKSNKAVFAERINGTQSNDYLASVERNGLLSKEQWAIINNIGNSRVRNVGFFAGLKPGGMAKNEVLVSDGDITAVVKDDGSDMTLVEITFANEMDNPNYKLHFSIQSQGFYDEDNNIRPIVWKPVSTTKADVYVEAYNGNPQNLKIYIDVIQL